MCLLLPRYGLPSDGLLDACDDRGRRTVLLEYFLNEGLPIMIGSPVVLYILFGYIATVGHRIVRWVEHPFVFLEVTPWV